jgi:16S rRNA (cytidine1402-2'-O)-methyltransferase
MAGTLFVVATPIGHLDDITLRALAVLRSVAVVAAEDTRRTGQLLRHFGIETPLISLHAHNERLRCRDLLARLQAGTSVAVVSDAGTPGLSDPGALVVREARAHGYRVEPVPGPSAITAALSVAGIEETPFAFLGFPPTRLNDRKKWFASLATRQSELTTVFFEAPHRIKQTLEELESYVVQPIFLMRELTKVHEEVLHGPIESLMEALTSPRGEFTVIVPRADPVTPAVTDAELRAVFGQTTELFPAASRRELVRRVAEQFRVPVRRVYDATRRPE